MHRPEAVVKMVHAKRGQLQLYPLIPEELVKAEDLLTKLFGNHLRIKLP
jgi:hypothetical protein